MTAVPVLLTKGSTERKGLVQSHPATKCRCQNPDLGSDPSAHTCDRAALSRLWASTAETQAVSAGLLSAEAPTLRSAGRKGFWGPGQRLGQGGAVALGLGKNLVGAVPEASWATGSWGVLPVSWQSLLVAGCCSGTGSLVPCEDTQS